MTHLCHAHECLERISNRLLMCKPHWLSLPALIRDAVWREYMAAAPSPHWVGSGSKSYGTSLRLLAVQRLAVAHTALLPNDEEAAAIAAAYLEKAEAFAASAIERGLGDPLEDLRPDGGSFR